MKVLKNLWKFTFMMAFILIFRAIFGDDNTLVGVGVYVAMETLAVCGTGMDRLGTVITIALAFVGGALVAYTGNLVLEGVYIFLLTKLTSAPKFLKLNIIYTLPFIFMQANPGEIDLRLIATVIGVLLISVRAKHGEIPITEYFKKTNTFFALRMSLGISIGILIANLMDFSRPMWITLVVMSLTQIDAEETHSRIKHRLIGTLLGLGLAVLIPSKYSFLAVLFIGYLGFFITDYRSKQIFNCISAFFASLTILGVGGVISSRILGLAIGIGITLVTKVINFKNLKQSTIT